jgi:hypothetical protein
MKNPLVVRSVGDLQHFSPRGRTYSLIVLEIDRLTPADTALWENRINRLARACGCEFGAAACVTALIVYAWYALLHGTISSEHWVETSLLGLGVIGVSATGGKIVGLIYSRRKLMRAIADLTRFLSGPDRTYPPKSSRST